MNDFTALPDVGWGHQSPVIRAGEYLFLSNIIGALPDGRIVQHWDDLPPEGQALKTGKRHLDFREGRLGAQTWLVLKRMQAILEANGSALENICKMQIYLTNKTHFPFMERVRMRLYDVQPPSSCLGVEQVDPSGEAVIAIDVVAAAVGTPGEAAEGIHLNSGKQSIGIFAPGIRTTEHVFLAGQIPIDLENGAVTLDWDDLPPSLRPAERAPFAVDSWDSATSAQTIEVYRQITRLLDQEGLSYDDVAREVIYLRSLRDYPSVDRIRRQHVTTAKYPVTAFQVSDVGSIPAINIEIDIVAGRSGANPRKQELRSPRTGEVFAARSGSLLFAAGQVGLDATGTAIALQPSQLAEGTPRSVARWGKIAPRLERAACQTAAILNNLKADLESAGLSLAALRKLDVMLADYRDYVAVNETIAEYFPDNPPAISAIQVPVAGPGKGTTVAIDAIGSVVS